jgi:hypothetical protein
MTQRLTADGFDRELADAHRRRASTAGTFALSQTPLSRWGGGR